MTDDRSLDSDRALYGHWLKTLGSATGVALPSATMLAAYASGSLDAASTEQVEAALARDPWLLAEVLAARRPLTPEIPSAAFLARVRRLVGPGPASVATARIVPFVPRPRADRSSVPGLRGVVAWGALAAGVMIVSMVGFNVGMATQEAIQQPPGAAPVDLLEQVDPHLG